MLNQTDDYLIAFLARDRIDELTSDRRRSELIARSPEPFGGLRDLFRSLTPSQMTRDRKPPTGSQRRQA